MNRWTHVIEADHEPDPHYNGNGLPHYWTCHKCVGELRLDGAKPPVTAPVKRAADKAEAPMSAQP